MAGAGLDGLYCPFQPKALWHSMIITQVFLTLAQLFKYQSQFSCPIPQECDVHVGEESKASSLF